MTKKAYMKCIDGSDQRNLVERGIYLCDHYTADGMFVKVWDKANKYMGVFRTNRFEDIVPEKKVEQLKLEL